MNSQDISKAELINLIKNWKQLDDELKTIQKEVKERRNKKKIITEQLVKIMRNNEIDCFDINNGKLLYTQSKLKSSISRPYLLEIMSKYFADDDTVEIDKVTDYILENRNVKIKEGIRCKLDKN
tara:strand:+ start:988 stop:1359 length:372 start_codon:yes stop_codon:yes gene_type:complete